MREVSITWHGSIFLFLNDVVFCHLENQVIRFRPAKLANMTTIYNPYANYDPHQGMTTALILGLTFILGVIYFSLKTGHKKLKTLWCYRKAKPKANDIPLVECAQQQQFILKKESLTNIGVPITIEGLIADKSSITDHHSIDLVTMTAQSLKTCVQNTSGEQVYSELSNQKSEAASMVISEKQCSKEYKRRRSSDRSAKSALPLTKREAAYMLESDRPGSHGKEYRNKSSERPVKAALPPATNQTLWTALWVSSLNSCITSAEDTQSQELYYDDYRLRSYQKLQQTVEAEINHDNEIKTPNEVINMAAIKYADCNGTAGSRCSSSLTIHSNSTSNEKPNNIYSKHGDVNAIVTDENLEYITTTQV